jgi:hypothetical protein
MNPPRSAYDAARARTLRADMALRPGVVTYDGADYCCAVSVEGEGYDLTDMGQRSTQRISVSFSKCDLRERPRRGAVLVYAGMRWEVELVGGDSEGDPQWSVTGLRLPGV